MSVTPVIPRLMEIPEGAQEIFVGPSHPATHGTVRLKMIMDHEKILEVDVDPGYLHRGFEKEAEAHPYIQVMPYTDRLNYVSPMVNNVGYAMAVEKLAGIEVPERAEYIRVIVSEISRVADHLTCLAASVMELGAMSVFLYMVRAREYLWHLTEEICGARMTTSYARFGGVAHDLPENFAEALAWTISETRKVMRDADILLTRNRIFVDRLRGLAVLSLDDLKNYGITGPILRASGIARDLRRDEPYSVYDEFDFDIPVGTASDLYDRYLVRCEEVLQSLRILEQATAKIPDGPTLTEDNRFALPPKEEVYTNIEALMNHFKLVMHGVQPPKGEIYSAVEAPNGELGFYLVSDGTGKPYKCRVHPPSFVNLASMREQLIGNQLADLVPVFGQINMIGGECDR